MMLPYEMTRCYGVVAVDTVCKRRHHCLRFLTIETDLKDRKYSQAQCLCYISSNEHPYYFYYLPKDDEE